MGRLQAVWPLVKRVLLRSGEWVSLLGARLVDVPGLQDDNAARDKVRDPGARPWSWTKPRP